MSPAVLLLALAVPPDPPAGEPFDLQFVPEARPARLFGLRPNELGASDAVGGADGPLGEFLRPLVTAAGGDGAACKLPPLAAVSEVLGSGLLLKVPAAGEAGFVGVGSVWCVVRTSDPFDWAALAAACFPSGVELVFQGQTYRRCPVAVPLDPDAKAQADAAGVGPSVCFFAADPRTLVVAFDEDDVKGLINRRRAGGRTVPPAHWAAVERLPIAFAADLDADRDWLTLPDGPPRPDIRPVADFLHLAGRLAVGVGRQGDRLHVTAVASGAAPDLPDSLRGLLARTGGRPWVRSAAGTTTATLTLPLQRLADAFGGD